MDIWRILEIEATKDKDAIRDAYRAKLLKVHPEEDPEGFKQLREAFEEAVKLADAPEDETEKEEVSEEELPVFDRIQRIAIRIYDDLSTRIDLSCWKELLERPEFEELDTSDEAREALLVVFMNRIFLPKAVWSLVVKTLLVAEERDQLIEKFPSDYIDYVIGRAEADDILEFERFESRSSHETAFAEAGIPDLPVEYSGQVPTHPGFDSYPGEVDQYINGLRFLWSDADVFFTTDDPERLQSNLVDTCSLLRFLETKDCWHPEEYFLKMRFYSFSDAPEKAVDMALAILSGKAEDIVYDRLFVEAARIYMTVAEAWDMDLIEAIRLKLDEIESRNPNNYWIALDRVLYFRAKGDLEEAAERLVDLFSDFGENAYMVVLLNEMDEILVPKYERLMEEDPENDEYLICRARYLGHLNRWEEVLPLLDARTCGEKFLPDQIWFQARANIYTGNNEKGREKLLEWIAWMEPVMEQAKEAEERGEEVDHLTKMRLTRKLSTYGSLGEVCISLGKYDEALEAFEKLNSMDPNPRYKIPCTLGIIKICELKKQYLKAMNLIEDMIAEFGPEMENLRIIHQNNAFRCNENQTVVDDYYKIIEVEPQHPRSYLLALRVFLQYDQTEDAQGVIDRARENNVSKIMTDYMDICMHREAIDNRDDAFACLDEMLAFREEVTGLFEESDENKQFNLSDLTYQIAEVANRIRNNEGSCKVDPVKEVKAALADAPENWDYQIHALTVLIRNLPQNMDPEEMAKELAGDKEPNEDIYYALGWHFYNQKDPVKAVPCLEKAVELCPYYSNAVYRLMYQYKQRFLKLGDPEDLKGAGKMAEQLVKIEPTFSNYLDSADMMLYLEAFPESIAYYEKALELQPEDYRCYNGLGLVACDQKEYDQAIKYYKIAIARSGGRRNIKYIYTNLIRALRRADRPEEAMKVWEERASVYEPTEEDQDEHGTLLFAQRKYAEGEADFVQLIEQAKNALPGPEEKKDYDKLQRVIDLMIRGYEAAVFQDKPKEILDQKKEELILFLQRNDLYLSPKKSLFGAGVRNTPSGKIYTEAKEPLLDPETGKAVSWIYSNLGLFFLYTIRDCQSAILYLGRYLVYNDKDPKLCSNYDINSIADRKVDLALAYALAGDREYGNKFADETIALMTVRYPEEVIMKYPGHGYYIGKTLMQAAGVKGDPDFMRYTKLTEGCVLCEFCKHNGCYEEFLLIGRAFELAGKYREAAEYYDKAYQIEGIDCEAKVARDLCRQKAGE